jgi:signal transduction histidine kinase
MIRSARFRLTVTYSVAVFGLAAILLAAIYFGLSRQLKPAPKFTPAVYRVIPEGQSGLPFKQVVLSSESGNPQDEIKNQERRQTLAELRRLTFGALGLVFLAALGIGYVVAGRVLRPVGKITAAARRIQASNLSERIALQGPQDELKTLADTFDAMLERLDTSFTAQRQFVADASHELRNPLAVIQTNADVALQEEGVPEVVRSRLDAVLRATDRMRRLVDDLLALARLELATGQRSEVDLSALVGEVGDELDPLARSHGLALVLSHEPGLHVVADRDAVKRALANLLDNAFRHSPRSGAVRVGAERRNGWAVLSVADDGPGLSPVEQELVFERFWRSDSSRSRESGGSGLGLAIVRRIAESHGGEVSVTSSPGSGSTFEIRLPFNSA